jgi:hypothetical protein
LKRQLTSVYSGDDDDPEEPQEIGPKGLAWLGRIIVRKSNGSYLGIRRPVVNVPSSLGRDIGPIPILVATCFGTLNEGFASFEKDRVKVVIVVGCLDPFSK